MVEPDLLSLVLTLRSLDAPDDKSLPLWWGRAAHSLLLNIIRQVDDVLAATLHETNGGPRPFTASTLIGPSTRSGLDKERVYSLRLTAVQPEVSNHLFQEAQPAGSLSPGATVELDHIRFRVESSVWEPDNHPWAGLTSYLEPSAPYLLAQKTPPRRVSFQFTSPTTFKSAGKHVPIPMPDLVFGNLLNRWNAFSPLAFPEEVHRYAQECLGISRFNLSSRVVPVKGRGRRMGGIGQVTFTSINYDRYWMSVIHTLAAFALYSGVGAGTSMGLGQCRMLEDGR